MKKNKIQNITIIVIIIIIIGSIIGYNYSVDQTKQKGFQFGVELAQIQDDVTRLQTIFYSEKNKWDEGDITKDDLLKYYERHVREFKEIIDRYDKLTPPKSFKSSVDLFKLSSQTQLESDEEYIKWIVTGDESSKIRSDAQIQEAYEYENLGLLEFQSSKSGVKTYDESEKFSAPQVGLTQKVIYISENMKNKCDSQFKNELGEFDSDQTEIDWFNCFNKAEKWKSDHLP
ncbi:MAG: hypothetical protein OEY17_05280 [Nitrosopumilus sp.]|nr:hypothetical protein [Nitrosopumilus sp.]MDH5658733.1 hypothetical protein [Nitrosopumilus sp.]